jgi:hypothetical protein
MGDKDRRLRLELDLEPGYPRTLALDNQLAYDDDWGISVTRVEGWVGPYLRDPVPSGAEVLDAHRAQPHAAPLFQD